MSVKKALFDAGFDEELVNSLDPAVQERLNARYLTERRRIIAAVPSA